MRDPEAVRRLGFSLYDEGMVAAEAQRPPGAVLEQAARLRSLAATATPAVAAELRELADSLHRELQADAWNSLAEAEEVVGSVWAFDERAAPEEINRRDERALARLASLREADPEHDRPLGVLAEWVRLRHRRRG